MKDLKAITLPTGDEIVTRCSPLFTNSRHFFVPLLVAMGANDAFMPHLHKMGERELVGPGVVMGLSLAIYDFNQVTGGSYPPLVIDGLNMMIPDFVKAIVDDPEVVADAMEILEKVKAEMAKPKAESISAK